jgi:hypothetical protein
MASSLTATSRPGVQHEGLAAPRLHAIAKGRRQIADREKQQRRVRSQLVGARGGSTAPLLRTRRGSEPRAGRVAALSTERPQTGRERRHAVSRPAIRALSYYRSIERKRARAGPLERRVSEQAGGEGV